MIIDLWVSYLYQPLFNVLIWIYNEVANQNMGWSVIILTVFLRLFLLPLSIISERDKVRMQKIEEEALKTVAEFKNDPVAMNEEYRKIIKANRISPWAKMITLLVQFLILIMLYRVFISGIFGENMLKMLYPSVSFPGEINNQFYGYHVGLSHNLVWAALVGGYLFLGTFIRKITDKTWEKSEVVFLFLFPLFVALILFYLPMAKSLFILTSMVFSDILSIAQFIVFPTKKSGENT